ncbi:unnamed protein product [Blepharisma stoltei]|uniref:Uncharacterized protein n=1 Tax=Blepharisma stoltei TaxID=1481888 RepID=A0AAU9IQ26_9CILI|nr:unnamed protein product [Blepharisma stoltei]
MGCCSDRVKPNETIAITKEISIKAKVKKEFSKHKKSGKYQLRGESKEELFLSMVVNHKLLNDKLKKSNGNLETKTKHPGLSRRTTRTSTWTQLE